MTARTSSFPLFTGWKPWQIVLALVAVVVVVLILLALPVDLLRSSIRLATPYVLGSLAALIASRAGVLNLAIEGKMTVGAFVAIVVLYQTGLDPAVGVLAAAVAGGVMGLIFAILYLKIRINLVVLALAVNLFIANATVFFMRTKFGAFGTLADPSIRSLSELTPFANVSIRAPVLDNYNAVVYLSWILVVLVWLVLYKTQFGRHIRAVGENREAAQTAGINVTLVQVFALTLSGMLSGIAGAFLSIGILSQFVEGIVNGRGWISITVSLFAFERPLMAFFTALFFGFSEAFSFYLQTDRTLNLPPDLVLALPQIVTILALVGVALRIRGGEILKRRRFAAQFGREVRNIRQGELTSPSSVK